MKHPEKKNHLMFLINKYIDHTCLQATATVNNITTLCKEACRYDFFAVCVQPIFVRLTKQLLKNSTVKIATVINFPLGGSTVSTIQQATINACQDKADEIDLVMNIGAFKAQLYDDVAEQIKLVRSIIGNKILKLIIETSALQEAEIIKACQIGIAQKVDFIKTSTGFGSHGARVEDVKLIRKAVNNNCFIKASGGIKTYTEAQEMITAGANRIGTSSGIAIIKQSQNK